MRNKPKIADHSALQISIALNRAKHSNVTIADLKPSTLVDGYMRVRKLLFCDFLEAPKPHSVLTTIFSTFEKAISSSTNITSTCHALSSLFISLNDLKIFDFGNNITVRKFIHDLSITLCKLNIIPRVIDFRHADEQLYEKQDITLDLKHMLTTTVQPRLEEDIEPWPLLPDASITIGGYKFLTYDDSFLVTLNGGLIEAETAVIALEKSIKRSKNPNDFTVNRSAITGYLFNNNNPISTLDGLTFGDEAQLMCLDVDHLTGLPMNAKFEELLHKLAAKNLSPLDIPELDGFKSIIDDKVRAKVTRLREYINIVKRRFFRDKKPATLNPQFFLSMGGIGSGKSSLVDYISEHTSGNHVTASIDKARSCSKLFDFYTSCEHHSDDYKSLKLFARCLVDEVTKDVLAGKYHYFRDSSGIPFGKNKEEISSFKASGYETHVYSASASLFVEKDRKDLGKPAHVRVMKRYRKKHRAVPWEIVIAKHVGHPCAILDALKSHEVDNLKIFDTTGKKGESKLMAYSKDVSEDVIQQLRHGRFISKGYLLNKLLLHAVIDEDDIPKEFLLKRLDFFECTKFDRKPTCHSKQLFSGSTLDNRAILKATVQDDSCKTITRIMVIFDIVKFIDLMQKGNLYTNAQGYDGLVFNSNQIHIPSVDYPYDKRHNECAWRLRNQIITNDDYLL